MAEQKKGNWLLEWLSNIRNTKKNWGKVKSSPYASLVFALKVRKILVAIMIIYIAFMGFNMVKNYHAVGMMSSLGRIVLIGVLGYVCWKIYSTIPQAKKQIEYYKKYPHLINYCPTNTKETIDEILAKIKQNKEKAEEAANNNEHVRTTKKETSTTA